VSVVLPTEATLYQKHKTEGTDPTQVSPTKAAPVAGDPQDPFSQAPGSWQGGTVGGGSQLPGDIAHPQCRAPLPPTAHSMVPTAMPTASACEGGKTQCSPGISKYSVV